MKRIFSPIFAAALVTIAVPAAAQEATSDTANQSEQSSDTQASGTPAQADALVVTVGEAEITAGDVETAIAAFPPQLAQQVPPQQLISVAVDQLVLRELILQQAMQENLAEDPEVMQLVEDNAQRTQEDAIVQVYLQRELDGAITDEAVQGAYDAADAQTEQALPPLEEVRPQVEQQLRQERLAELRQTLMGTGSTITFYDESGEPVDEGPSDTVNGASSGSNATATSGEDSVSNSDNGGSDSEDATDSESDSSN